MENMYSIYFKIYEKTLKFLKIFNCDQFLFHFYFSNCTVKLFKKRNFFQPFNSGKFMPKIILSNYQNDGYLNKGLKIFFKRSRIRRMRLRVEAHKRSS